MATQTQTVEVQGLEIEVIVNQTPGELEIQYIIRAVGPASETTGVSQLANDDALRGGEGIVPSHNVTVRPTLVGQVNQLSSSITEEIIEQLPQELSLLVQQQFSNPVSGLRQRLEEVSGLDYNTQVVGDRLGEIRSGSVDNDFIIFRKYLEDSGAGRLDTYNLLYEDDGSPTGNTIAVSQSFDIPTVTVPVPEELNLDARELAQNYLTTIGSNRPSFDIVFSWPDGLFGGSFGGTDSTSVTVDLSPDLFIQTRKVNIRSELGSIDCREEYSSIFSEVSSIRSEASTLDDRLDTIESEANNEMSSIGLDISQSPPTADSIRSSIRENIDNIQDFSPDDIVSGLQSLRDRLSNIESGEEVRSPSQLISSRQNIEGRLDQLEVGSCAQEVQSELDNVPALGELQNRLSTLQSKLDEFISRLDGLDISTSDLVDCAEVDALSDVRQRISEFENVVGVEGSREIPELAPEDGIPSPTEVSQTVDFSNVSLSNIRRSSDDQLRYLTSSDLRSKLTDIESELNNVDAPGSCIEQARSRINNIDRQISTIPVRSIVSGTRECVSGIVHTELQPIEKDLGLGVSFEEGEGVSLNELRSLDNLVGIEDRVGALREDLRSPRSLIESLPDDDPCKQLFEQRLRRVEDRLDRLETDRINCGDRFSDVRDDLEDVRVNLEAFREDPSFDDISNVRSRIEDARSSINNMDGGSGCQSQFRDELTRLAEELRNIDIGGDTRDRIEDALDCTDIDQELRDSVDRVTRRVDNIQNRSVGERSPSDIDDIISEGQSLISRIESEVSDENPCKRELKSRIEQALNSADSLRVLGCQDIPQRLRNNVSSIEAAVSTFRDKDRVGRLTDRKNTLLSEVSEYRSSIEDEVVDDNPCKEELLSKLDDIESRLENTQVRQLAAIPCDERFSDVGSRVNEFENRVVGLSAPVNPQDLQQIAQDGRDIIASIEENTPAGDPCRRELVNQMRRLLDSARSLTESVTIVEADETQDRSQQLLEQALEDIGNIEVPEPGETPNLEDVSDEIADR